MVTFSSIRRDQGVSKKFLQIRLVHSILSDLSVYYNYSKTQHHTFLNFNLKLWI